MQDRGGGVRDEEFLGVVAEVNARRSMMDRLVRNVSQRGALAGMIRRQAGRVGLAFRTMLKDPHSSDLDERLRRSQIKQRQLKRRIDELLGQR